MYLTDGELNGYYPEAASLPAKDRSKFLQRANGFAFGEIKGIPQGLNESETTALKTAVGLAFEMFAKGETGQVNEDTGEITELAPEGAFVRSRSYKDYDPFKTVRDMLAPFAAKVAAQNYVPERGVKFY